LVDPIATRYRGQSEIPFDELQSVGMAALVKASRRWEPTGPFAAYAEDIINFAILDFIEQWESMVPLADADGDQEKLIYEWQNGFFALYERWESLPHSPWDIRERFETVSGKIDLMSKAYRSLSKRDRQMVEAYFLDEPRVPLGQIANDHRLSYQSTQKVIWRALGKMREIVRANRELVAA
jgi:RNA polymerase sigma factor (sigma-70 family)